ncbi:hypothetical protein UQW22_15615 [Isoptericola halotolerans]|uniref:hypothetical protein n=1 Tax=Isoptericola halotolerans TaxID=300560 RepID=UPI0038907306
MPASRVLDVERLTVASGEVTDEFLLGLAGIAATLVGTFIVAVFFYLDSALHRSRGAAGSAPDQYMRAGARWVLIAYSLPLFVALALAGAEPVWGAVAFLVFVAALVVATVDTTRRIVKKGATRKSPALAANEICTSLAVAALAVLPWVLGGWIPSPSDFVPSMLLALAIGFTSTAMVIMSVFDAARLSAPAPEPAAPSWGSATRRRRRL